MTIVRGLCRKAPVNIEFGHVHREKNKVADFLANVALVSKKDQTVAELGVNFKPNDGAPWDPWKKVGKVDL